MFRQVLRAARAGLLVLALCGPAHATGQSASTSGTVIDVSGAVIPEVEVTAFTADGRMLTTHTDAGGAFSFAEAVTRVRVRSEGFAPTEVAVGAAGEAVRVVLRPSNFADSVVVTATRSAERLPSAASATVVTSAELVDSAAGTIDDALRQTPGFSLFRRSSSRVANPTTQGVTLRGVSGSGSSRTLVLADGVPLNDPFGGWVYWNRIPQAAIDRVEVVRGATGDLYGAGALGGVIQILSVPTTRNRARVALDGGSHDTARASVFGNVERQGWVATGAYEGVRTDGAFIVAPEERGPVDRKADSDYQSALFSGGRAMETFHGFVRVSKYSEDRGNGTPVQVNATDSTQVTGDLGGIVRGGVWQARLGRFSQDFYQTFSAVATGRRTERLTTEQSTDSTNQFVNGQWARPFGRVTLVAGGDFHYTDAKVSEFRYSTTNVKTGPFLVGGTERLTAAYTRATVMASDKVTVELGGRGDWWRSEPLDPALPTKTLAFFSPRASAAWRAGRYSVQGAVYRASRTPTLNELHRGFRVGNAVTNANPLLAAEVLTGVEGGVLASWGPVSGRATAFFSNLDQAIANITLSSTPTLITRQRQNSDSIRASGVELEVDARLSTALSLTGQLVLTSSHFRGSVGTPDIEGNDVPQVPVVQGGVSLIWIDPRWATVSTQVRFSGKQFDDDLNQFTLGSYAVWDGQISRTMRRGFTAFLAVENITDTEYDTGRTPIRTIGWPRTFRAGVRVAWR